MYDNILSKIYYGTERPGSFGCIASLYREAVKEIPNLTKSELNVGWADNLFTRYLSKLEEDSKEIQ